MINKPATNNPAAEEDFPAENIPSGNTKAFKPLSKKELEQLTQRTTEEKRAPVIFMFKKKFQWTRSVVYTKDLENLTGKSARSARRLMKTIREKVGKTKKDLITIKDVSFATGIDEETVTRYLMY